ncbi:calcium ATPase 2 [Perilla frutescens var. hirtella]|uniref:Calcium ATPase 2 n=1 Tax=Perilla frutescens var. hirtella TaxID=608512 RepID=A0AAD4J8P0_PERFH|nr:calcium ATPase 2 [Perilla frutescens var. hirtella]
METTSSNEAIPREKYTLIALVGIKDILHPGVKEAVQTCLVAGIMKEYEEVVAVTGDGTNNAPALHEVDIGLAMGIAGTEVAKESVDVVIMDDNLTTMLNVAKWGRSVYIKIQKFCRGNSYIINIIQGIGMWKGLWSGLVAGATVLLLKNDLAEADKLLEIQRVG